jgi:myosin heavy subunit
VQKVAHLLGLDVQPLVKALTRPTIRINNETTVQGRTAAQVVYSVEALCKATYVSSKCFFFHLDCFRNDQELPPPLSLSLTNTFF